MYRYLNKFPYYSFPSIRVDFYTLWRGVRGVARLLYLKRCQLLRIDGSKLNTGLF